MVLKAYVDRECTKEIYTIEWDNEVILKLVNGREVRLQNTAKPNEVATAVVYLRNVSGYPYMIKAVYFSDKRLSLRLDKDWLEPSAITKLMVEFVVPEKPTPKDVIKAGRIEFDGYHIYS